MSSLRITKPNAGEKVTLSIPAESAGQAAAIGFATSGVNVERVGNDLVFQFGDGAETRVADFFATGGKALPDFVLEDGTTISSADVLKQLNENIDLETAAGPGSGGNTGSGGAGEYADDAGSLIGGVNALGFGDALGQWGGAEASSEIVPLTINLPLQDISASLFSLNEDMFAPANSWANGGTLLVGVISAMDPEGQTITYGLSPAVQNATIITDDGSVLVLGTYRIAPATGELFIDLVDYTGNPAGQTVAEALANSLRADGTYSLSQAVVTLTDGVNDTTLTVSPVASGMNDAPEATAAAAAFEASEHGLEWAGMGEGTANAAIDMKPHFTDADYGEDALLTYSVTNVSLVNAGAANALLSATDQGELASLIADGLASGVLNIVNGVLYLDNAKLSFDSLAEGASFEMTIRVTATDPSGASAYKDVVLTVNGVNDAPEITVVDANDITENQLTGNQHDGAPAAVVIGGITAHDEDTGDSLYYSITTANNGAGQDVAYNGDVIGTLTVGVDGTLTFTPTANIHKLPEGHEITVDFTVRVDDRAGGTGLHDSQNGSFKITGSNDEPAIGSVNTVDVTENQLTGNQHDGGPAAVEVGSVTATDVDGDTLHYSLVGHASGQDVTYNGDVIGTLTVGADGKLAFTPNANIHKLPEGHEITVNFEVRVDDRSSGTGMHDIETGSFKITGSNDAPVIGSINTVNVTEDQLTGGTANGTPAPVEVGSVSASDVDTGDSLYYSLNSANNGTGQEVSYNGEVIGTLTVGTDGKLTFTPSANIHKLPEGHEITVNFEVQVDDRTGGTGMNDTKTGSFTITGSNDGPVWGGASLGMSAYEDTPPAGQSTQAEIDLTGKATDIDGDTLTYSVTSDQYDAINASAIYSDGALQNEAMAALGGVNWADIIKVGADNKLQLDTAGSSFDFLAEGETITVTVNVTVSDGKGGVAEKPVTVTITGTNDAPEIDLSSFDLAAGDNVTFRENDFTETDGTPKGGTQIGAISATDDDLGDSATFSFTGADASGRLAVTYTDGGGNTYTVGYLTVSGTNNGNIYFTPTADINRLPEGHQLDVPFEVTATDTNGGADSTSGKFTIVGDNDGPRANIVLDASNDAYVYTNKTPGGIVDKTVEGVIDISDMDTPLDGMSISIDGLSGSATAANNSYANAASWNTQHGELKVWFDASANGGEGEWSFKYTGTKTSGSLHYESVTFKVNDGYDTGVVTQGFTVDASVTLATPDYVTIDLGNLGGFVAGTDGGGTNITGPGASMHDTSGTVFGGVLANDITESQGLFDGSNLVITGVSTSVGSDAAGTVIQAKYGTITINADGSWEYTVDPTLPAYKEIIAAGQTGSVQESITYLAHDPNGTGNTYNGTLVITFKGENVAPEIEGSLIQGIQMQADVGATTTLNLTGAASDENTSDTLTFSFGDSSGTALQKIDPADAGSRSMSEDMVARYPNLQGTPGWTWDAATDSFTIPDNAYVAEYGWIYQAADGTWQYQVDYTNPDVLAWKPGDPPLTETIKFTATDNHGASATEEITINITGKQDGVLANINWNSSTSQGSGGTMIWDDVAQDWKRDSNGNVIYQSNKPNQQKTDTVRLEDMDGDGKADIVINADSKDLIFDSYTIIGSVQMVSADDPTQAAGTDYRCSFSGGTSWSQVLTTTASQAIHGTDANGNQVLLGYIRISPNGTVYWNGSKNPAALKALSDQPQDFTTKIYIYGKDGTITAKEVTVWVNSEDDLAITTSNMVDGTSDFAAGVEINGKFTASDYEGQEVTFHRPDYLGTNYEANAGNNEWSVQLAYGKLFVNRGTGEWRLIPDTGASVSGDTVLDLTVIIRDGDRPLNECATGGDRVLINGDWATHDEAVAAAETEGYHEDSVSVVMIDTGVDASGNLFANDDVLAKDGAQIITTGTFQTEHGGTLVVEADGTFTYYHPGTVIDNDPNSSTYGQTLPFSQTSQRGFSDTFEYQIVDKDGNIHTQELNINVKGMDQKSPTFSYWNTAKVFEGGEYSDFVMITNTSRLIYDWNHEDNYGLKLYAQDGNATDTGKNSSDWGTAVDISDPANSITAVVYAMINGVQTAIGEVMIQGGTPHVGGSYTVPQVSVWFKKYDGIDFGDLNEGQTDTTYGTFYLMAEDAHGNKTVQETKISLVGRDVSAANVSLATGEGDLLVYDANSGDYDTRTIEVDVLGGSKNTVGAGKANDARNDIDDWDLTAMAPEIEGAYGKLVWNGTTNKYDYKLYDPADLDPADFANQALYEAALAKYTAAYNAVQRLTEGDAPLTETFDYTLTDVRGEAGSGKVTLSIEGRNDGVTNHDKVEISFNEHDANGAMTIEQIQLGAETADAKTINYEVRYCIGTDGNGDPVYVTFNLNEPFDTQYGTITVSSTGSVTFIANGKLKEGEVATEEFEYRAYYVDGNGNKVYTEGTSYAPNDSAAQNSWTGIEMTITGENDAPVCNHMYLVGSQPGPIQGSTSISDVDSDTFTYKVVDGNGAELAGQDVGGGVLRYYGKYGYLDYQPDGNYSYVRTADTGFAEGDIFYVRAWDSDGAASNVGYLTFHAYTGNKVEASASGTFTGTADGDYFVVSEDGVTLTGGAGADIFSWSKDILEAGETKTSTVTDFEQGTDVLDLRSFFEHLGSNADLDQYLSWDQASTTLTVTVTLPGESDPAVQQIVINGANGCADLDALKDYTNMLLSPTDTVQHKINGTSGDDPITVTGDLNYTIWGGAGDDTVDLSGSTGDHTLLWLAGDQGSSLDPAVDTVIGFDSADALDLRGLLADLLETGTSLSDIISFEVNGGNTTINIASATDTANPVQQIVLTGTELNAQDSSNGTYEELAQQILLVTQ